jgi:hypothetical protein
VSFCSVGTAVTDYGSKLINEKVDDVGKFLKHEQPIFI